MDCCEPGKGAQGLGFSHSEDCCSSSFERRFYTAQEEREELEAYRDELKKELAGLEERLSQLKKK